VTCVIDSSALLALLKDEPGADAVESYLAAGMVSAINYAETLSKAELLGLDSLLADRLLMASGLQIKSAGLAQARQVTALAYLARDNISLADRFCLALALEYAVPVVTGDRAWALLALPVQIERFR
jgi:ribonuclease VapC